MTFDRYAFDLSQFTGGPQNVVYTVREKYIWELLWPRADDALYAAQPDQYRSELHDRLATPLYPLAFVILAYTFLGPPQTTRQSRTLALLGMIGAVSLLRLIGFVSVIVGVRVPGVLGRAICRAVRRDRRRPVANLARAGRRARRRRIEDRDRDRRTHRAGDELEERTMITGTLSRYFGMRFLTSVVGSFIGVVALAAMIDYVELMRRGADWPNATAWVLAKISMFRVPQLTERIMPFSVLVGAMSCYLRCRAVSNWWWRARPAFPPGNSWRRP